MPSEGRSRIRVFINLGLNHYTYSMIEPESVCLRTTGWTEQKEFVNSLAVVGMIEIPKSGMVELRVSKKGYLQR